MKPTDKPTGIPQGQPYPSPSPSPLLSPSPKKISESQKALIYKIENKWPKVWMWMQFQANRGILFEDTIKTLENYWEYRETVGDPWPYCNRVVQALIDKRKAEMREKDWKGKKQEEADFAQKIARLLEGIGKPIEYGKEE